MALIRNYRKPFSQFLKTQTKVFQAIIEDEVNEICKNNDIGEPKVGDLSGIRVYKFKFQKQEYLIAYSVNAESDVQFILIDFYKIGVHENFYDELKRYLKNV